MKDNSAVKSRLLLPLQLAEDANRGFVKVFQNIGRLINYDFHTIQSETPDSRFRSRTFNSRVQHPLSGSKQNRITSVSAPNPPSFSDDDLKAKSSPEDGPAEMVTLLFSDLAEERLSAVRWIADHKIVDALPMLESILLIEDDHQVYEEASNLINILRETNVERP